MEFAVAQFGDFEGDFFLFLFGLFFDGGELFAQFFVEEDSIEDGFCGFGVFVEQVEDPFSDLLDDLGADFAIA